ncbi:charged multivesicular body protein 4b [Harmonia axyridis]|uniref:charged multivesicular body protein 4b n=1 Tax=Harmonia axyridis TaxID=115357 RepID=UPI001E278680|nr:charged multivesicular body protein 4b [Harmonia axyridis]
MSFFSKIFGGKTDEAPSTGAAIQKLRETEEMLNKKQAFLEKKIEQEILLAKQNAAKNKRAAIQALKRKKRYEKQLQQIDGTLTTLELQRGTLEEAVTNTDVIQTMKNAADAIKHAHKHMNVDQVHDIMDDIAEQQDVANEISQAISNPIGFGEDIDEDELNKELEELEQETLDSELLDITLPTNKLPEVPKEAVKPKPTSSKKAVEDDEDMKALAEWAS